MSDHHHHHQEDCCCGHHKHKECGCNQEHHHDTCGCGHHHHEQATCGCGCGCGHDHHQESGWMPLVFGATLFAAGLVLQRLTDLPLHLLAFVAAYLILGWEVLTSAGKNILKGHIFDENFLMSIATLGAFAIGEYPEAVGVMLFFRAGEYFEHKAVERSRKSIMDAVDMRPEVVQLRSGAVIPAEQAKIGDEILVAVGDRIPLDGVVVAGQSQLDTAPITGESVPVSVESGSRVISGCVNLSGQLILRVEKPLSESVVTRILHSVENAAASKPQMDRFLTRFARVYTPIVVTAAALVAVVPSIITGNWNYWVYTALSFLVMSCPCALVLSVPLAFFSGIGAGSKLGILFKGGASIEAMTSVKMVALDKTGTVTKGEFAVQSVTGGDEVLRLCASCETASRHPIASSIVAEAERKGLNLSAAEDIREIAGYGICGTVDGRSIACGNEKLMATLGIVPDTYSDAQTRVYVAVDGKLSGEITISDTLKPDAQQAVSDLKAQGIAAAMLTGDNSSQAEAIATQAGIDTVYARLLPDEKLAVLQDLRKKYGAVMFVGDGINDAPVLSGADVGAAMGSGADAAIEAADVVFMTSQMAAIPQALKIARRTRTIAVQNVVFALAVKLGVMALGLLGFASMWAAVFADSGVAMLCVLNAVRALRVKK